MSLLTIHEITRRFRGQSRAAVCDVSLSVAAGELVALVGASGSGKSTLLRLIAGLEHPDAGTIALDQRVISSPREVVPPEQRGIGFVFQDHALFPHLTVAENIAFGLHCSGGDPRGDKTRALLQLVGLPDCRTRYPHELSGGERQRVALARSLAPAPRLLLLDEPFSSLDTRLRQEIREETRAILRQRGTTAIIVTHDVPDAFAVADRILLMRRGEIQQAGIPATLYREPANDYVATFFGLCNFLPAGALPLDSARTVGPPPGSPGGVWIRPEDLLLVRVEEARTGDLPGMVERTVFSGDHIEVHLRCTSPAPDETFTVIVRAASAAAIREGERWAIRAQSESSPLSELQEKRNAVA
jgi:iron(III) transport system ATP-binding protein